MNLPLNRARREGLIRLLSAHQPSRSEEEEYRLRMFALLHSAGDPFDRGHIEPGHFTASAFVLSPAGSSILMIHHSKLNRWLQPGGHVDPEDPDVVATAVREVAEETGLEGLELLNPESPVLDVDIHRIPVHKGEPAHEHFDLRFLFQADDDELTAGSDALLARWVPLSGVDRIDSDRSVMRAVEKIRQGRRGAKA